MSPSFPEPSDRSRPPLPPKPKSPSTSKTTTSTTTSLSPRRRGSKRGLPWPWDHPSSHFKLYEPYISAGKLSWVFNWELWVPASLPSVGVEWIPCVRTASNAKDVDGFLTDIIQNRGLKSEALLGFNEPEISEQANLSIDNAVEIWRRLILPAKRKFGLRLGSPGMTSDVGRSKPWLNSFLAQFEDSGGGGTTATADGAGQGLAGSGIDFLVLHWYGLHFADMQAFLEDMHATYGLPVWINEFACSRMGQGGEEASADEIEDFLRQALPWLDQCEWIERYAYFGNAQGRDVGTWVGRASNFTEVTDGARDTDGRKLSRIGKLYCEL